MTRDLRTRAMPARSPSAPTRSPRRSSTEAAARAASPLEIVRTGSRGLFWLEPLVEVATPAGRIAYGPVAAADVACLFDAGRSTAARIRCASGRPEEIPFLKRRRA